MKTNSPPLLILGERDYLEMPGLNVMLGQDFYPEGHQSGLVIIQHGRRVASNGDLRLEDAGGQWQPVPRQLNRFVDAETQKVTVSMAFPDPTRDGKGFNPIAYPDLEFAYRLELQAEGRQFRIKVELQNAIPSPWQSKIKFCLELFPGWLFGHSFSSEAGQGVFPRQPNGPMITGSDGVIQPTPLARGNSLDIAPDAPEQHIRIERVVGGELSLTDARGSHNNGWFIVQATLDHAQGSGTLEWLVTASADPSFRAAPVLQVNQVGYRPLQEKRAYVELDKAEEDILEIRIEQVQSDGSRQIVARGGQLWGVFLRSRYLILDFSPIRAEGIYLMVYGTHEAGPFRIAEDVYTRHVWQPTLEYFLPIQMCHMRVEDGYRVWHGVCHRSDAVMASPGTQHFDGYTQGQTTFTQYAGGETVKGLNEGGWHDAGDFDLRVESQAVTVHGLALAHELFDVQLDSTTVSWSEHLVVLRKPDGTPDILQQIEHGVKSLLGSIKALGLPYRGIIEATLKDYVLLGDPLNHQHPRLVFTEDNPAHQALTCMALASASRLLSTKPTLARNCLEASEHLWNRLPSSELHHRIGPAVELLLASGGELQARPYVKFLTDHLNLVSDTFDRSGWLITRVLDKLESWGKTPARTLLLSAAMSHRERQRALEATTPYGVPYRPNVWGAGWSVQNFGMQQLFLSRGFPDIFPITGVFRALDFVLGCHPGQNNASLVSGVGAKSVDVAYGLNRADHSSIPGGSVSGPALIQPDFPELLEWPYLWQQTEYVLGGGTTDWLLIALAADHLPLG